MHRIIGLTGLALLGFLVVARADDDADKAIAAITKLGGKIERDEKKPGSPVIAVDFRGKVLKDADLAILKPLGQIESLKLDDSHITDEGLKHLKELKHLRRLTVSFTAITDEGLKHLSGLSKLEFLHVGYCAKVTDKGKGELRKTLPKLKIVGP